MTTIITAKQKPALTHPPYFSASPLARFHPCALVSCYVRSQLVLPLFSSLKWSTQLGWPMR